MDAALITHIGISILLPCRELQQFLMTVLIHPLKHPRESVAIVAIIAAGREEMPTRGMEALAQTIIALDVEVRLVTLRTFALPTRTNADTEVFKQNLGDSPDHDCPLSCMSSSIKALACARSTGSGPR